MVTPPSPLSPDICRIPASIAAPTPNIVIMALRMGRSVRIILIMNKLEAFGHIAALAIRGELVFPTSVNAALRVQLALDLSLIHI